MSEEMVIPDLESSPGIAEKRLPRQIERAIHNAMFIAQHIDNKDDFESIKEDWKYVAMVIDDYFSTSSHSPVSSAPAVSSCKLHPSTIPKNPSMSLCPRWP
ncbi:uncharacterized protein TNCT_712951 [Trichonephila clavata]|uniref:Neurotransmitter-gated ion-channel transmembrane domain-containing protein n=1 Tax=Trichonephila clavata TaxID=2740835 RepID=A0A8X6GDV2_TRICU|nr:uncharacterized protein TNCT_712951 [Trichonephila clavata]